LLLPQIWRLIWSASAALKSEASFHFAAAALAADGEGVQPIFETVAAEARKRQQAGQAKGRTQRKTGSAPIGAKPSQHRAADDAARRGE
jgi:hypothetical protein